MKHNKNIFNMIAVSIWTTQYQQASIAAIKKTGLQTRKVSLFAFHPKATKYVSGRSSGSSCFGCLPISLKVKQWRGLPKHIMDLQLRVQLPFFTRFPFHSCEKKSDQRT